MKRLTLLVFISFIVANIYAQITFEKGYFVDNSGQKLECFIKNLDWLNNPTEFEYKTSENSDVKLGSIETIQEFGIYNTSKYIRQELKIDRSSTDLNKLDYTKEPFFENEILFLKVLVEGQISLYQYLETGLTRFFYGNEEMGIEQLVYKVYKKSESQIKYNNSFRQQLWLGLRCTGFKQDKFEDLNYSKRALVKVFVDYNECVNQVVTVFGNTKKRKSFNLTIRPGFNYSSAKLERLVSTDYYTDFGSKLNARFGVEAEYILPFNKNKWALMCEPAFQYFKAKKGDNVQQVSIDYQSIELALGLRHYMFLNENSKLFFDASYIIDKSFESVIVLPHPRPDLNVSSSVNYALGLGYKFKDKYSAELRYCTRRDLLNYEAYWLAEYNTISLILGYTIFSNKD